MSEERNEEGLFATIKKNILYVFMVVAVIIAILYSNGLPENKKEKDINTDIDTSEVKSSNSILKILAIVLVIGGAFIYFMISGHQDYIKQAQKGSEEKSFVSRLSKEDYSKITEDTTKRELEKLMTNPKFKEMLGKKGDDPKNWIWQTRDKEKRVVYRDRESSDEEDNLSQLTISDD